MRLDKDSLLNYRLHKTFDREILTPFILVKGLSCQRRPDNLIRSPFTKLLHQDIICEEIRGKVLLQYHILGTIQLKAVI